MKTSVLFTLVSATAVSAGVLRERSPSTSPACCPNGIYTGDLSLACDAARTGDGKCYGGSWVIQCSKGYSSGTTYNTLHSDSAINYETCFDYCLSQSSNFEAFNLYTDGLQYGQAHKYRELLPRCLIKLIEKKNVIAELAVLLPTVLRETVDWFRLGLARILLQQSLFAASLIPETWPMFV
jgi:hypothetical protein